MLPLPVDGKCGRLLTRKTFACGGIALGWYFVVSGRCGTAKCAWDTSGETSIFREATAERGKVTAQLLNESLALKFDGLCIALERPEGLIELLLTGTEATLRLFVGRNLALNLNLQRRLGLHTLFSFGCRGTGGGGKPGLFCQLGTEICDTCLKRAALLSRSSDPARCSSNGGITTGAGQLPRAQRGSIGLNSSCETRSAGDQFFYASSPLRCRVGGNRLFRGERNLVESCLGCGDSGIKASDAVSAL